MSKKSDFRDSIKQPDTFISASDRALKFIEQNSKLFITLFVVVATGGVGYTAYNHYSSSKEMKAAEHLYKVEAQLKKAETQVRDERAKKMQELTGLLVKSKDSKRPEELRPVDFAKDFAPIVTSLKAALKDQAGTRAAMVSALNLSYFLVQQKQFQEALEVMKTPGATLAAGDLLGGFWRMHYGLVLLENNQADEALRLYDEVLGTSALKPFHSEALLKTGIANEIKGDAAKARDIYEKLGRDFPNTEASSSAAQYLRLMELKAKG